MNERMDQKFSSVAAAKLRQFELEPTVNVIKINQELRELLCLFLSLESALFPLPVLSHNISSVCGNL